MATGIVKFFNEAKGYGFITPDGGSRQDIFVHITSLRKCNISNIQKEDRLEFETEERNGKIQATNIRFV